MTNRYLVNFDTQMLSHIFTDVAVVGSGVAGLRAAIQAARHAEVIVVTKDRIDRGSTPWAQGGIAAVLHPDDTFESHIEDTLKSGHELSDPEIVKQVVHDGPRLIREMMDWGASFDKEGDDLHYTQEGGHSGPRIIHAHGDSTGFEITRCLADTTHGIQNIRVIENTFCLDLLTHEGTCVGLLVSSIADGIYCIWARQIILATGGCGQMYRETTNPEVVTGDGMAAAYRAGAALQDMEFVQFHPTTLYVAGSTRALISEAVRGEGGILINRAGKPFMSNYHEKGGMAPRDVVSQSIVKEMKLTEDTNVFLDVRHIPKDDFKARFPRIYGMCEQFDVDIAKEPIPVRPAQHYMIGGVKTDGHGRTNVAGLLACGEVTSTGLHGANRLGSNSLLEGLVFGFRSGEAAGKAAVSGQDTPHVFRIRHEVTHPHHSPVDLWDLRHSLKSEMWRSVGIERDERTLKSALQHIDQWSRYALHTEFDSPSGWEVQNMLTVGRTIISSALERTESRGAHFRKDFPEKKDEEWVRHICVVRDREC
ncbi:MAG: L-aspartate oxidase [Planctomycetota bacterium]|jgi:L-aspartate oxidase|nr:L-aspartate oxidase [Planctomycetota bacterium]